MEEYTLDYLKEINMTEDQADNLIRGLFDEISKCEKVQNLDRSQYGKMSRHINKIHDQITVLTHHILRNCR